MELIPPNFRFVNYARIFESDLIDVLISGLSGLRLRDAILPKLKEWRQIQLPQLALHLLTHASILGY